MHAALVFFRPLLDVGIQNFSMWGMYNLAKAYSIKNPLPITESRTGKPAMVTLKIQPDCSMVHDTILWANIYVRSHFGCGTDFENKLNLTCQAQSTPKTTGILTKVFSTSGPNLVALAWTGDELSCGQAHNGVNFFFEVKFDLEGQGQSPPKTIGILTKVFYAYGPNLVILAWTDDELSRGQTWWRREWWTDWRTDAGNDNTRRPILASGKNIGYKCCCLSFVVYHKDCCVVLVWSL